MREPAIVLAACLLCDSAFSENAGLPPRFQTVYILGRSGGVDQWRLTSARVLCLVLKPPHADVVKTDSTDDSLWAWLSKAYPTSDRAAKSAPNNNAAAAKGDASPRTGEPSSWCTFALGSSPGNVRTSETQSRGRPGSQCRPNRQPTQGRLLQK